MKKLALIALMFAMLPLSGCGDDADTTSEPVSMTGFYASINAEGMNECQTEEVDVYFGEGPEDLTIGEPNVRILSKGDAFEGATFGHIGIEVEDVIVSAYVTQNADGTFATPGAYFLMAQMDADIAEEPIYTGLWVGQIVRLEGNPVVVCPYVMVPAGSVMNDGCGESPTDITGMHEGLAKYLKSEEGLRSCKRALTDGVLLLSD